MFSSFEFYNQEAQPSVCLRTHTSIEQLPGLIVDAYGKIQRYLVQLGEEPAMPPYAAYFNMDMQNMEVELGFPVRRELPGEGELQPGWLPGGLVAQCLYTGPYDQIAAAYEALGQWIPANGYDAVGPAYEFYLNDPAMVLPEQLQTRIVFPIKEKATA